MVVVGRGGGLARGVVLAARDAGARVVAAGRDQENFPVQAYACEPASPPSTSISPTSPSIEALGKRLGSVSHVVSTASARARGKVPDLDRESVRLSFDTKVIGPLMLAKHLAPRVAEGGCFVIFSGVFA